MQFSLYINQVKALEWGLNAPQAMLFAFLYELPSWADPIVVNNVVHYRLTKAKVIEELPLLTDKPDTVYRLMCQLRDLGVIAVELMGNQPLLTITEEGKTWNHAEGSEKNPTPRNTSGPRKNIRPSENNPAEVGKKSEEGSEKNPTYQYTNNQITKSGNSSLRSESRTRTPKPPKIDFDPATGAWLHLDENPALVRQWAAAYPAVNLQQELAKAAAWLMANPENVKSNYPRFLTNWLTKAQDRAPRVPDGTPPRGSPRAAAPTLADHNRSVAEEALRRAAARNQEQGTSHA